MKVDIVKYYPDLEANPYPKYLSEVPEEGFEVGDLLFDKANNAIGMVLGCIDYKGGELRLDSDGMRPIEDLRYAKLSDVNEDMRSQTGITSELAKEISS